MPLSNLEIHWVVEELQPAVGSYLDRISDLDSGWKLKFGNMEIVADVPESIYISHHKRPARPPHGFTQYARKRLHGKLVSISQPGFDRIVVLGLDSGQKLVFELFSHGNAVIVGADGLIEKAFRDEEWSARKIKRGERYALPPSGKLDPREMTKGQFNALFGEKDVIHSLVSGIKMGGSYLELACAEAGVDKNAMQPNEKLFGLIKSYLESYEPGIQAGKPVVRRFPGKGFSPKKSLSEAIDELHAEAAPDSRMAEKVRRKIAQQEGAIAELERKAELYKEAGDAVYGHWQELAELIEKVGSLRKKGLSYDEINEKLGGKAFIDKKSQKMTVKL